MANLHPLCNTPDLLCMFLVIKETVALREKLHRQTPKLHAEMLCPVQRLNPKPLNYEPQVNNC